MASGGSALSFFAIDEDLPTVLERLNADPDVAFLVPDGPKDPEEALWERYSASPEAGMNPLMLRDTGYRQRWKAVREVSRLRVGAQSLWHVPTGPLPLVPDYSAGVPLFPQPHPPVADPWSGWTEKNPVTETPFLDSFHGEIRLELWTRHRPYSELERARVRSLMSYWNEGRERVVASSFSWIGGRYSPPPAATRKWWNRLKAWLARETTPLAALENRTQVFFAFPAALRLLGTGVAYEARGWNLDPAIQAAQPR
jgi:hypothetical protein